MCYPKGDVIHRLRTIGLAVQVLAGEGVKIRTQIPGN